MYVWFEEPMERMYVMKSNNLYMFYTHIKCSKFLKTSRLQGDSSNFSNLYASAVVCLLNIIPHIFYSIKGEK